MKTSCVILAAGAGRRMGGQNKALLQWQGRSFLQRIAESCNRVGADDVVVVVSAVHEKATRAAAEDLGLATVSNPRPERGMASSVSIGFTHALTHFRASSAWLWPVDCPATRPDTLLALSAHAHAGMIVSPRFLERGGHPSLVGRDIWPELATCSQEEHGARSVFRRERTRRIYIDVQDAGVCHDVDVPSDMRGLPC